MMTTPNSTSVLKVEELFSFAAKYTKCMTADDLLRIEKRVNKADEQYAVIAALNQVDLDKVYTL